jgi:hypothetical protein
LKREVVALTFTPKYDIVEDRIRLSINYNDIKNRVDFMITRAFILKLLPYLDEYMFKFYNTELTASTNIPELKDVDEKKIPVSTSTSKTDNTNLELYKQDDELLITVNFSYIKKTKISILKFQSENSQAVAQLNGESIKQVFMIIKSTIPFFSWGISHNI